MTAPSIVVQTAYAELLELCAAAAFREAFPQNGTFVSKTVKGRRYWYFQEPSSQGRAQKYAGPETPELLDKISRHRGAREDEAQRRDLVSALFRVQRTPRPSPEIAAIVAALAKAGVFRLRGVLVGTVAFQTYAAMLGMPMGGSSVGTEDVDIAQFRNVSVAVDDKTPPAIDTLRDVDETFRPVPHNVDGRRATRYQAKSGLRVDFLTPNKGADTSDPQSLPALRTDAEPLRFLDFLIHDPEPAVVLHGAGTYVLVPSPQRFAVHKLIVSRRRSAGSPKRDKDLRQASVLLIALARNRPFELREAFHEAFSRGKAWKHTLVEAMGLLEPYPRDIALKTMGEPRSIIPSIDLAFGNSPVRYDTERDIVRFTGEDNLGRPVPCAISREALEDHFAADGLSKTERVEIFQKNREDIEALTREKFLRSPITDTELTLVKTEDVKKIHSHH